jgi:AAA+ superfamily predicted ATPase
MQACSMSFLLIITLSISSLQSTPEHSVISPTEMNANEYHIREHRLLKQTDELAVYLQELTESLNADAIHVINKPALHDSINNLQDFIRRLKEKLANSSQSVAILLEINKQVMAQINHVLRENSNQTLTPLDLTPLLHRSEKIDALDSQTFEHLFNQNQEELNRLIKQKRSYGITTLNRFARNIDKMAQNRGLLTITKRLLPYMLLTIYATYITDKKDLPACMHGFKDLLGGNPDKRDLSLPVDEKTLEQGQQEALDKNKNSRVSEKLPVYKAQSGILGTPAYHMRNFIDIDTRPFMTYSLGSYFVPILKKDIADISRWASEKRKQLTAYLKGDQYDDPSPVKYFKALFDDIVGYDLAKKQLSTIVQYFKSKELFDHTGTSIERGLLFVGQLDISKLFVHSLAGEISRIVKIRDSENSCGIYEIHASQLITKKIDDIIKDLESEVGLEAPAILYIEDLNWLCNQTGYNISLWSELINAMNKNLSGTKKHIIIIASVRDIHAVDTALKGHQKFGSLVYLNPPTCTDRALYFARELAKRGVNLDKQQCLDLATQTQECSYNMLAAIIKQACTMARIQHEVLTREHIEQSIDTTVHHIVSPGTFENQEQRERRATNLAGQIITYLLKKPRHMQLIKATLCSIGSEQPYIRQGGLIKYNHESCIDFITADDMKIEALIALAGIEAEKIVYPDREPTYAQLTAARTEAFVHAKKIVLQGDQEKDLPKELLQKKLTQIHNLVDQLTLEVRILVHNNLAQIKKIAHELMTHKILRQKDFHNINAEIIK